MPLFGATFDERIPLRWRGVGVGCPQPEDPTPKAAAFCPSQERIVMGAPLPPSGSTTKK